MSGRAKPPRAGARVTYKTDGKVHEGVVQRRPDQGGNGSFPVQDTQPPYGYIQAWPGDPRIIEIEDDDA